MESRTPEIKSSIFSSRVHHLCILPGTRSFLLLEAYSCVIKQFANWKPAWFPTMGLHTVLEKVKKKSIILLPNIWWHKVGKLILPCPTSELPPVHSVCHFTHRISIVGAQRRSAEWMWMSRIQFLLFSLFWSLCPKHTLPWLYSLSIKFWAKAIARWFIKHLIYSPPMSWNVSDTCKAKHGTFLCVCVLGVE